jgi:hypothetical protein
MEGATGQPWDPGNPDTGVLYNNSTATDTDINGLPDTPPNSGITPPVNGGQPGQPPAGTLPVSLGVFHAGNLGLRYYLVMHKGILSVYNTATAYVVSLDMSVSLKVFDHTLLKARLYRLTRVIKRPSRNKAKQSVDARQSRQLRALNRRLNRVWGNSNRARRS